MKKLLNSYGSKEKLFEIWKSNEKFNKSETAELLGISKRSVFNWVKEFDSARDKK